MKVARSPAELERRDRAVAIGTFDGVHLGHRRVIETALGSGPSPTVVTFDPHPRIALGYEDGVARLDLLVSSGTYVRAIADALGGHCLALRRTEVGPFSVEEADELRILPAAEALPFMSAVQVSEEEAAALRQGRRRGDEGMRYLYGDELVAVGRTVLP